MVMAYDKDKPIKEGDIIVTRKGHEDTCIAIDYTFFTRLFHFACHAGKMYGPGDFIIDEEWTYIRDTAKKLQEYQFMTADKNTMEGEYDYAERILKSM